MARTLLIPCHLIFDRSALPKPAAFRVAPEKIAVGNVGAARVGVPQVWEMQSRLEKSLSRKFAELRFASLQSADENLRLETSAPLKSDRTSFAYGRSGCSRNAPETFYAYQRLAIFVELR